MGSKPFLILYANIHRFSPSLLVSFLFSPFGCRFSIHVLRIFQNHRLVRRTKMLNKTFYASIWYMVLSIIEHKMCLARRWMESGIFRSNEYFARTLTVVETTQRRWQSGPKCVYTRDRLSTMTIKIDHLIWCGCVCSMAHRRRQYNYNAQLRHYV